MRKMKKHYSKKDCIVELKDHLTRKRGESGKSEEWIRHNILDETWKDFKPEVTEADKTKIAIDFLDDEARRIKKQYIEKMKALDAMRGKGREAQESSSDE